MKFGSAGAIRFAVSATSPISTITPAPISAILWRRKRRQTVLREGTTSSAVTVPGVSGIDAAISGVLHARIEPGVAQIGEQVAEDDQERDQHHVAHQHREVELPERVVEEPSHPRPVSYTHLT